MTGAATQLKPGERLLLEGLRRHFLGHRERNAEHTFLPMQNSAMLRTAIASGWRTKTLAQFSEGMASDIDDAGLALLQGEVKAYKHRAMAANAGILAQAGEITGLLEARSIDVLAFKGALQQYQLSGDYFVRPTADLDLLVHRRDYHRALAVLGDLGYVPTHPASRWWDIFLGERHLAHPGGQRWTIDLHHRLQQPGVPQPRDLTAFFLNAERLSIRGRAIPVVGAGDVPLVSAMNLLKGLFRKECTATHACDLMRALCCGRAPDQASDRVTAFLQKSEAQGISGTAWLSLRILDALSGGSFAWLGSRLGAVLPEVDDESLAAMVLAPESMEDWPRRRRILGAACMGDKAAIARESVWYAASEAVRYAEEARH